MHIFYIGMVDTMFFNNSFYYESYLKFKLIVQFRQGHLRKTLGTSLFKMSSRVIGTYLRDTNKKTKRVMKLGKFIHKLLLKYKLSIISEKIKMRNSYGSKIKYKPNSNQTVFIFLKKTINVSFLEDSS